MSVAQTILAQLGGRKFLAMTGAKNLVGSPDALSFRLPSNFATNKANVVRITLTVWDDYTVEYSRLYAGKLTHLHTDEHVYAEDLQQMFTAVTGLATHV